MRGTLGFLMLVPVLFVFSLALALSMLLFAIAIGIVGGRAKRGGLWRLLGVLSSLVMGGICLRLGYWLAIQGAIDWRVLTGFPEVRFFFLEWLFPVMFPGLGWVDMIGGVLLAVIGTVAALSVKQSSS